MHREIKFQAWNKRVKQLRDVEEWKFKAQELLVKPDLIGDTKSWLFSNCTIRQYTGLIDSNKKEIWEFDIVKHHRMFSDKREVLGMINFGQYEDEAQYQCWHHVGWNIHELSLGDLANQCEVVGNIFENPELIGNIFEQNNITTLIKKLI